MAETRQRKPVTDEEMGTNRGAITSEGMPRMDLSQAVNVMGDKDSIRSRKLQESNVRYLMDVVAGNVPSESKIAAQKMNEQNLTEALMLSNLRRGPAPTLSANAATQALSAQQTADFERQAQLRAQEVLAYNQLLANQMNTLRGQDLGLQQAQMQADAQRTAARKQRQSQILGGVLGAATLFALSDKNTKTEISSAQSKVRKFMDDLSNYNFNQVSKK